MEITKLTVEETAKLSITKRQKHPDLTNALDRLLTGEALRITATPDYKSSAIAGYARRYARMNNIPIVIKTSGNIVIIRKVSLTN